MILIRITEAYWIVANASNVAECSLDSFLLTGMVEQSILEQLGFQVGEATLDEKAEVLFLGQLYGSKFLSFYIKYIYQSLPFSFWTICMHIFLPLSFLASAVARQLLCLELYLASPIPFDHSQMTSFVTVRIWCSFMFLLIHMSQICFFPNISLLNYWILSWYFNGRRWNCLI